MDKLRISIQDASGTWRELPQDDGVAERKYRQARREEAAEERRLAQLPPEILFIARTRKGWLRCSRGHQHYAPLQFLYWRNGTAAAVSAKRAQRMLDRTYPSPPSGSLPRHRTSR